MKILVIHRNVFQNRPPLVSLIKTMTDYGLSPTVVTTGLSEEFINYFKKKGIDYYIVPFNLSNNRFSGFKNFLKSKRWGRIVKGLITRYSVKDTLLWIEGNYTFTSLSTNLVNSYKHVLQIQEMFNYPGIKGYLYEKVIAALSKNAEAIIVPEYNRAFFYKLQFKLKRLPFVLPNKPAFVPDKDALSQLHQKFAKYDRILEKKVILYQGIISGIRSNYIPVLEMFKRKDVDQEYVFVFLGNDPTGYVDGLKEKGYNVEHIPFISAPEYLYFTSRAYIGIVNYSDNCLNNIFCAPNKIYEYSAFGVPMLANDIPGLRYTIGINKCGCLYSNENGIEESFDQLVQNYKEMSDNAKKFFAATDYYTILGGILDHLRLV